MDSRDTQPGSFATYAAPSQDHSTQYENQDSSRQHYGSQTAPNYLARTVYDPRQYTAAAAAADPARPTTNGYGVDPNGALGGFPTPDMTAAYQGYPPNANHNWRAEWYPPVTNSYSHANPMGATPMPAINPLPVRTTDSRIRRARGSEFSGNTVYSFVPLPGAQQQKRPRRRYEEIERIYKCGWQGCEKAYGTLNHLNAHVTMQTHGPKRTPEEFKETRKEWKARKKEEENRKKAEQEAKEKAAAEQQAANPSQSSQTPNQTPQTTAQSQVTPQPLHPQQQHNVPGHQQPQYGLPPPQYHPGSVPANNPNVEFQYQQPMYGNGYNQSYGA
ncbi:uncharacterized protein V1510DRAFT_407867 [Dipodascopsis tothii]|uniref:uncharacterized protein n=1 Tax=Dipodascopsis tothii TaxID=44089 RepID=UPI0034CEA4DF